MQRDILQSKWLLLWSTETQYFKEHLFFVNTGATADNDLKHSRRQNTSHKMSSDSAYWMCPNLLNGMMEVKMYQYVSIKSHREALSTDFTSQPSSDGVCSVVVERWLSNWSPGSRKVSIDQPPVFTWLMFHFFSHVLATQPFPWQQSILHPLIKRIYCRKLWKKLVSVPWVKIILSNYDFQCQEWPVRLSFGNIFY